MISSGLHNEPDFKKNMDGCNSIFNIESKDKIKRRKKERKRSGCGDKDQARRSAGLHL